MFYSVLTEAGSGGPFTPEQPIAAPGSQLRVSKGAMLIAFQRQPIQMFCQRHARGYGKILWSANGVNLHAADLEGQTLIKSTAEFVELLLSMRGTKK